MMTLAVGYRHAKSKRFEAVVDSGSPWCLFHSEIGKSIGIKIEKGRKGKLGGVLAGTASAVYFHPISLWVPGGMIRTTGGFSPDLAVAGILGRQGFFDKHIVTFDPTEQQFGEMVVERFHLS